MDMVSFIGQMMRYTKENFTTTKYKVWADIPGATVEITKATGKLIRCMAKASTGGKMAGSMSVALRMIVGMVTAG